MRTLIPGVWYLMFLCQNCNTKQILFPDLTQGKSKLLATYTVACQSCGHKATYEGEQIERYQHPPNAMRAVAC